MTLNSNNTLVDHNYTHTHAYLHECQAEVVGSAAPVHRVLYDVEGKACHLLIHQNAKVITWDTHTHTQSGFIL